jgi:hypothetical protein
VQSGMPRVHEPSECGIPAGTLDHDRDDLIAELIQNDLDQTPRTATSSKFHARSGAARLKVMSSYPDPLFVSNETGRR